MADKGMCERHDKRTTCGVCKHPVMSGTRKHVSANPFPVQKK